LTKYHGEGIKGQGIKIAILDSGIGAMYQTDEILRSMNIVEVIDFTKDSGGEVDEEPMVEAIDKNGHGTFVAGIIGSQNPDCPGMAPDAEIYILKLFTDDEITYSSWFIDAFNFVLDNDIDIVNLSTASKDS